MLIVGARCESALAYASRVLVALVLVTSTSSAAAQDLEPGAYSNTPIGLNFLIAGYAYTSGGVAIDPALPLKNADVEVNSATLAYARSIDLLGRSAKFDIVLTHRAPTVGAHDVSVAGRSLSARVALDPEAALRLRDRDAPTG